MLSATKRRHEADASRPLTFAEASPRWVGLSLKVLDLCTREAELLAESQRLSAQYRPSSDMALTPIGPPSFTKPAPDIGSDVRELLGDLAPEPVRQPAREMIWSSQHAKQAAGLEKKITDVRAALAVARSELTREHARASRLFCETKSDAYAGHVLRITDLLHQLSGAIVDERGFVAELRAEGCSPVFLPLVSAGSVEQLQISASNARDRFGEAGYPSPPTESPRPAPDRELPEIKAARARLDAAEAARHAAMKTRQTRVVVKRKRPDDEQYAGQ